MIVEPIRLIGASHAAELKVTFLERLQSWWGRWSNEDSCLDVAVMEPDSFCPMDSHGDLHECPSEKNPLGFDLIIDNVSQMGAMVAWRVTQELELEFFRSMCGVSGKDQVDNSPSSLVSSVVRDLIEDLVSKLMNVPDCAVDDQNNSERSTYTKLDYEVLNPFKYFRLKLEVGGVGINLWIPKAHLPELVGDHPTLTDVDVSRLASRTDALASQKIGLQVVLGEAELTVEELTGLKVGDVIGLDKPLDEPLVMERVGGNSRFHGFLGSKAGKFGFLVESLD